MTELTALPLVPFAHVLAEQLRDPAFRERWERTALARAVAIAVVAYRAAHELSQRQLAEKLGMKQPAIARLEAGEHNPSVETLIHLSRTLGMEFLLDISPAGQREQWVTPAAENAEATQKIVSGDHRVLVAAR